MSIDYQRDVVRRREGMRTRKMEGDRRWGNREGKCERISLGWEGNAKE